jgi:hypothetical protein
VTQKKTRTHLLPELGLRDDAAAMRAVMADAVQVYVADLTWGRPTWLFARLQAALQATLQAALRLRLTGN